MKSVRGAGRLEAILGQSIRTFAYPYGRRGGLD